MMTWQEAREMITWWGCHAVARGAFCVHKHKGFRRLPPPKQRPFPSLVWKFSELSRYSHVCMHGGDEFSKKKIKLFS